MDATAEANATATREDYKSRPGALIWFFQKSRDRWKSKHQSLKAKVKGFKNQVAAVTKSREQWRAKAERAGEQVTTLETENAALRAQIAALEEKKTDQGGSLLMLTPEQQHVPRGQHYAVGVVFCFVSLVLTCGASLRCAASVLEFISSAS